MVDPFPTLYACINPECEKKLANASTSSVLGEYERKHAAWATGWRVFGYAIKNLKRRANSLDLGITERVECFDPQEFV